jgi:hypothetical protein
MSNRSDLAPRMSYPAIADALGLSTEEVRRIERRALKKLHLRLVLNEIGLEDMAPDERPRVRRYQPD